MIRVLLADDHALVRAGIHSLQGMREVQVVGEASSGEEAIDSPTGSARRRADGHRHEGHYRA